MPTLCCVCAVVYSRYHVRCCSRHKSGCVSGSHLLFHVTGVVKGGVEKCCVNAFCVTVCLCISLYMWCLCDQQCAAVVHGAQMRLVCERQCCMFLCTHDIWASGPLLLPSASFWAVSCAMHENRPECLTLGMCCWVFCVCGCSLEVSACVRSYCPLTIHVNGTVYWGILCVTRGESGCGNSFHERTCSSHHVHDV